MPGHAGSYVISQEFFQHTRDVMDSLREDSPVSRVQFGDGSYGWLITRYEDVMVLSSDPRVSHDMDELRTAIGESRNPGGSEAPDPYGGYGWIYHNVLYMDPPDHTRLRKLVNKAFTARAIDRLAPRIEETADELLGQMIGLDAADLMASFAVPLPMAAICELLGIPGEDRPDFWAWSDVINGTSDERDLPATLRTAVEYLTALAERKRANPKPDLLSQMVLASEDGEQLSRKELISMALLMVLAGHDTTVNLLTNGTLAFLEHPDQLALLRSDPSLLPNAIEEILRYDCPVNVSPAIVTRESIELSGVLIPAGEILYVSRFSANRDPRQFIDPDRFDITRDTRGHVGFGHGIHFCLGAPLARVEGRIALGKLFERFPKLRLAVEPEELTYRTSTLMHGPKSLPVHLS
jgi:cytochrome P450